MNYKLQQSVKNIYEFPTLLWNRGLIIIGLLLGFSINPFFVFLIIPSMLFELKYKKEEQL